MKTPEELADEIVELIPDKDLLKIEIAKIIRQERYQAPQIPIMVAKSEYDRVCQSLDEAMRQNKFLLFPASTKKMEALIKSAKRAEYFFAHPEEHDGPEQADIHCDLTNALEALGAQETEGK